MNEKTIVKGKLKNLQSICIGVMCVGLAFPILYLIVGLVKGNVNIDAVIAVLWMSFLPVAVVALWLFFGLSKTDITVTNFRVTGSIMFGRRIDIPAELIERVVKRPFGGVLIITQNSYISFYMLENRDDIIKAINNR